MDSEVIEKPQGGTPERDFTPRITHPYLIGVYLAVNAIPDAYLFLDGPECFPLKTTYIQGNHDLFSTLSNVAGMDRSVTTQLHPSTAIFPRDKLLVKGIRETAGYEGVGLVFVCARPMASLLSMDYGKICRNAQEGSPVPIIQVPPKSLSSNWLGGYEETLLALAQSIDFSRCKPGKKSAAVVGYMFDRNEGDHAGNLAELKRIFDSLGVKIETVWLSGQKYQDLLKVKKAGAIISLPYGRKAAKYIADKMKVPLIETCLPFGFEASGKFIRDVAAAFGKEKEAESLIDRELGEAVPKLEWVVPFAFQNSRVGFIGDPNHLSGFLDIAGMLGSRVAFAMLTADKSHYENGSANLPENVIFEPRVQTLLKNVKREISENGIDLVVASNVSTKLGNTALMEFGFPSYFTHLFVNRPFLFYKGCLAFVESMYNTIRQFELHNLM